MLFHSFAFLLVFFPLALLALWLTERVRPQLRLPVLLALSFAFYGFWDLRFVPLLAASIVVNHLAVQLYHRHGRRALLVSAIAGNLAVLGLFKYLGFLAATVSALGLPVQAPALALPLGISFFTFHHVMFLADTLAGRAPRTDLVRYGLYIAFFPQILAGPLVRWSEILHQFEAPVFRPGFAARAAPGLILLVAGLFKKVVLGDGLAEYANPIFAAAAAGTPLGLAQAWQGVLAFSFQIFFDFSGYTDMAIGLALILGIRLPPNFDRPYLATSLSDFWRRWHMTLSRFLRDYLYIPLGGNRHGLPVQVHALVVTMTLGGLWHGAGWTFVLWGLAQGLGLVAGVLWRRAGLAMPAVAGWALTFGFVTLAWVLFRAESLEAALAIYRALFGFDAPGGGFKWRILALAALFALVLPLIGGRLDSAALPTRLAGLRQAIAPHAEALALRLTPTPALGAITGLALLLLLLKIGNDANYEFIYFQF